MACLISGALMALNLARHTVCCPGGPGRIHLTVLSITWPGRGEEGAASGGRGAHGGGRGRAAAQEEGALGSQKHSRPGHVAPKPPSLPRAHARAPQRSRRAARGRAPTRLVASAAPHHYHRYTQRRTSKQMFSPSLSQSSHSTRWSQPLASPWRWRHRCIWGAAGVVMKREGRGAAWVRDARTASAAPPTGQPRARTRPAVHSAAQGAISQAARRRAPHVVPLGCSRSSLSPHQTAPWGPPWPGGGECQREGARHPWATQAARAGRRCLSLTAAAPLRHAQVRRCITAQPRDRTCPRSCISAGSRGTAGGRRPTSF